MADARRPEHRRTSAAAECRTFTSSTTPKSSRAKSRWYPLELRIRHFPGPTFGCGLTQVDLTVLTRAYKEQDQVWLLLCRIRSLSVVGNGGNRSSRCSSWRLRCR
eukprot:3499503-Rhodomonas_salina.1